MAVKTPFPVVLRRYNNTNIFHGKMPATKFKELKRDYGAQRVTFIYPAHNFYREVGEDGSIWFYIPTDNLVGFLTGKVKKTDAKDS